jgi:citrate lyase subunit beta / citryl-CoA lyase
VTRSGRPPRSFLFIPGDRPERLAKAFNRGADALIADLEDAVAVESKDTALDNVDAWLGSLQGGEPNVWVRVNGPDRRITEIERLAGHARLAGIVLPKVEHPSDVGAVADQLDVLGSVALIAPMIESAVGFVNIHSIATAARVYQLHLGEVDLAADLGARPDPNGTEFLFARSLLVIASRAAALVPPAAPVTLEIEDVSSFEASTRQLMNLGFHGRDCVHPRQVEVANGVFSPSPDELAWAAAVLNDARANGGAFRDSTGAMVDEAVLRRARDLLS